ncbi:MAG: acyltransferase family protein [Clostridia bacterium]|nr:acyltransferase family protein [Clostridia bacterium]
MTEAKSPLLAKKDNRDYLYDNMKAFLIISVVVGHFASGGTDAGFGVDKELQTIITMLKKFIYIYHMPVFMMVSGRFAKSRIDKDDWPKVISKVFVPYMSAQILMMLLCCLVKDVILVKNLSFINPLYGMWYMFNVAVYTIFTAKVKDKKWLFPLSCVLAIGVGFAFSILYGGFHRLVCYYPFFLFGYLTANVKFDICKKPWFRVLAAIAFIALAYYVFTRGKYINYSLLSINKTYWTIAKATRASVFRVMVNAIGRYIMAFVFFFIIIGITPSKKTIFSFIGQHSVYVYILHLFIVIALRNFDTDYKLLSHINTWWELAIYFGLTIVLSFILASKPIRVMARPFLAPNFDLSKAAKKLAGTLKDE